VTLVRVRCVKRAGVIYLPEYGAVRGPCAENDWRGDILSVQPSELPGLGDDFELYTLPQTYPLVSQERPHPAMQALRGAHGGSRVLIVGCGPSGASWRKHDEPGSIVIACNAAVTELKKRCDYSISLETSAEYQPWWTIVPDNGRRVINCRSARLCMDSIEAGRTIPALRSWHLAGWQPRHYINPALIPEPVWLSESNHYQRYATGGVYPNGIDPERREFGLLIGPAYYLREAIGSIALQALHFAAYLGASQIDTIGLDFCFKRGVQHWLCAFHLSAVVRVGLRNHRGYANRVVFRAQRRVLHAAQARAGSGRR
jgi:hypothetical protein